MARRFLLPRLHASALLHAKRKPAQGCVVGRAFTKLAGADVVFLDPDNGLAPSRSKKHFRSSVKYVFEDEVTDWLKRGQSVILYQHQQRRSLIEQVASQRKLLDVGNSGFAVSFHRLSVRIYYILPVENHRARLLERLNYFLESAWRKHFTRL